MKTKYSRLCPDCGDTYFYELKDSLDRAIRKKSKCHSCCQKGVRNHAYGKRPTDIVLEKRAKGRREYVRSLIEKDEKLNRSLNRIPLTKGLFAHIDSEDYDRVNQYKWHVKDNGNGYKYACRSTGNKTMKMHRFLLNAPDGMEVDHKNRDGLDNRKSNIRICTHQENMWNSKSRVGTSKYKGVSKEGNRYRSQININNNLKHIGCFGDEVEAAIAYDKMAVKMHGEFARCNFTQPKLEGNYAH